MISISGQSNGHACHCIGAQPGYPVCPCRMRNVKEENGRWVERIDLGPVRPSYQQYHQPSQIQPTTGTPYPWPVWVSRK